jgi:hypothetical protein
VEVDADCLKRVHGKVRVNSRTHVPQKRTGSISLSTNPYRFKCPYSNRPLKPLTRLIGLRQGCLAVPSGT